MSLILDNIIYKVNYLSREMDSVRAGRYFKALQNYLCSVDVAKKIDHFK